MSAHQFFLLTQIGVSLLVSIAIIRRFRKPLRQLVVRFMPLKQRLADNFLQRQTRISTITAFAMIIILTGLFSLGIELLKSKKRIAVKTDGPVTTSLLEKKVDKLSFSGPPKTTIRTPEKTVANSPSEPNLPVEKTEISKIDQFFIQVGAFDSQSNAEKVKAQWSKTEINYEVHLNTTTDEIGAFKVWIGPFPTRDEANAYLQREGINGFVRKV